MAPVLHDRSVPSGPYDLIVVGGGINGTAIARDAAARGHSVVLFEKGDLASGTSSGSSKMIHGGIRYLERLDLLLVYESLRERHILVRLAPHVIRPQSFILPLYEGEGRNPRLVRFGLWLYDKLSLGRRLGRSSSLTREEVLARVPELRPEGLAGGGVYWDAVMDDARVVVLNALGAIEEGKRHGRSVLVRTRAEVTEIRKSSPNRVVVHDRLTGRTQEVLGHRVVRALGPWTAPEHLIPSKGVHIVLPAFPSTDGLLLQHSTDRRVFFVIPWQGLTVVGTTETPFTGSADSLRIEEEDIVYLLRELRRTFPKLRFGAEDILGAFAGIRPLARRASRRQDPLDPGVLSRNHRIIDEGSGVFSVFGGKYTTFRAIAADVVDRALGRGRAPTHRLPLPGGESGPWLSFLREVPREAIERWGEAGIAFLYDRYGSRTLEILALCRENPELGEPLLQGLPELRAEVVYGLRREFVVYPEDFIARRTLLRFH
ncbi:MAG TPA: glycerol-3-phosphate dehydrogenase/oxidase, partial [Planctomycetota bacterium]|nr:glycerol-3-phosphate dehydrogenase/oxidase [Planctomycetota bacterium]